MKIPLNVVHVSLTMGTGGGGLENIIVNLIRELNGDIFKSTVGCLDEGGVLLERLQDTGVKSFVTGRKPGLDTGLIIKLSRLFSRKKIHIVHTHNQAAHFYASIAAKLARVPVIVTTEHSRHNTEHKRIRQFEKRMLAKITDKWIVVSEELAEKAVREDGVPQGKIVVVKNGVDFKAFSQGECEKIQGLEVREQLKIPSAAAVFIMVARLHPIKNHTLFLQAFAQLVREGKDVHTLFVGDGECREGLERQCRTLGIEGNVDFLGYREDVAKLLKVSDVFVLCSKTEGLPVSLLEACAAEVPVLITRSSNKAALIRDKENGTVVRGTLEELLGGMHAILQDMERAREMAVRSAQLVREDYSLRAMANRYQGIYLDLLLQKKVLREEELPRILEQ